MKHSIHCAGYRGVGKPFDEVACDCTKSVACEIALALAGAGLLRMRLGDAGREDYTVLCDTINRALDRFGIKHLQRPKDFNQRPTDGILELEQEAL